MVACVFSTLVAHRLKKESIYTLKLVRRGINIRHGKDVSLLDTIKVEEVMSTDFKSVPPHMTLRQLIHFMEDNRDDSYPVVDRYGNLQGVVAIQDLRTLIDKEGVRDLVIVADIIGSNPVTITPDQNLNQAFRSFGMRDLFILPVVDPRRSERVIGVLYRRDVLLTYNRRLLQQESSD